MGKIKPKKERNYTAEALEKALDALETGLTLRSASKLYGVPKSTLFSKATGQTAPVIMKKGPASVISAVDEAKLVDWILSLNHRGCPISKAQLLDSVEMLTNPKKQDAGCKEYRPGRHWYENFLKRHPQLHGKLSQKPLNGSTVTEAHIRDWFDRTKSYLEKRNLQNVDPSRVFNCAESSFSLSPPETSSKPHQGNEPPILAENNNQDSQTVLFCANARGDLVDPMVMYKKTQIPASIVQHMPPGWGIGRSENGLMTGKSFYDWMRNIFHPWLIKNQIVFPVILFMDENSSHLTLPLCSYCQCNQIELIVLQPSTRYMMQPWDVSCFGSLRSSWRNEVHQWRVKNQGDHMRKGDFVVVLKRAMDTMDWRSILPRAFQAAGLHPFTPKGIHFQKHFGTTTCHKIEETSVTNIEMTLLEAVESYMEADIVCQFRLVGDEEEWAGNELYRVHFEFWRRVKLQTPIEHDCSRVNEYEFQDTNDGSCMMKLFYDDSASPVNHLNDDTGESSTGEKNCLSQHSMLLAKSDDALSFHLMDNGELRLIDD